jgi:hypothetical protein
MFDFYLESFHSLVQETAYPSGDEEMKIQSSFWKPRLPYLLSGIIAVPIIIVIAGYIIFTTVAFVDGGFTPREVYSFTSPDNLSRVVIAKRTAFPASEFVDPAIVVTIELREVRTDIILGLKELQIHPRSPNRLVMELV